MKANLKKAIATPLSDSDIHDYLPSAKIIKYNELNKYPTIDDLLPNTKEYCFILYESSPNSGHWTCVSKPRDNIVEYFDSYGGPPDNPMKWTSENIRIGLGEGEKILSKLFNECSEEVVYNKIKYQKEDIDIADCGRWCVLRILRMKAGDNLNEFHKWIENQHKIFGGNDDSIVTQIIP